MTPKTARPPVEEVARKLASAHVAEDDSIVTIWWCPAEDEVRLVEVTEDLSGGGLDEILPFAFVPTEDVPYRSAVILLSPDQAEQLAQGELELPAGFAQGQVIFERGG